MKYLFLICVSVLLLQGDKEKYTYKEKPVLTWEDFKGTPPAGDSYEANVNSGIGYSWDYDTSDGYPNLQWEVKANFYPKLSWVKPGDRDDSLLKHEQLHWDIAHLYAMKLDSAMGAYTVGMRVRRDLRRMYDTYNGVLNQTQIQYDTESDHSENKEAQARWSASVKQQIESLETHLAD